MKIKLDKETIIIPESPQAKIGVGEIKKVVSYVGDMMKRVASYKKDGKYTGWEKFKTVFHSLKAIGIISHFERILDEIDDLKPEEDDVLVQHISEQFEWPIEKAQKFYYSKIKIGMTLVMALWGLGETLVPFFFPENTEN